MPLAERRGTEVKFVFFLAILLATHCLSRIVLLKLLYPTAIAKILAENQIDQMFARAIWRGAYIIGMSALYWLIIRNKNEAIKKKQLEIDRLEAIAEKKRVENTFLQMQLAPHLISNSLAYIHNKIDVREPEAAHAVELLADIIACSMLDVIAIRKAPLKDEISNIKNLIALHGALANTSIAFDLSITGEELDIELPPNILLTFIDNVFNHGIVTNSSEPARVDLMVTSGFFAYTSSNLKRKTKARGNNLGMQNVKSILDYFYPDNHELLIRETNTHYQLNLKIML